MTKTIPCIRPFAGKQGQSLYKKTIGWLTALADVNVSPMHDGVYRFNFHFEVEDGITYFIRSGEEVDDGYHGYLDEERFEVTSFFTLELGKAPRYFWTVPASSSGKYHPQYALGDGGLVRHVKAAVKFANNLAVIYNFLPIENDLAVAALLLHDLLKQGKEGEGCHTVFDHPLLAAAFIEEQAPKAFSRLVAPLVRTHMGQWTTSKYAPGVVLPKPSTALEKFVHECDYLASRKDFEVRL